MQGRRFLFILGAFFLAACLLSTALSTPETTLVPTKALTVPTSEATLVPQVYTENPCDYILEERPEKPTFKGMELYSWQNEYGDWMFSILYGTNRNKGVEEIKSFAMDIAKVKECFCNMPDDEEVFWMVLSPDKNQSPQLPDSIIDEVKNQAILCNVNLRAVGVISQE